MKELEKLHLEAIKSQKFGSGFDQKHKASEACAKITLEFMGKFSEWVNEQKELWQYDIPSQKWIGMDTNPKLITTTEELIKLYLNTLDGNPKG